MQGPDNVETKSQKLTEVVDYNPPPNQLRSARAPPVPIRAMNNIADEAKSIAARAMDYAKELTAPMDGAERANIPSSLAARARSLAGRIQTDTRSLAARSLGNYHDIGQAARSAMLNPGDVTRALQNKYLTRDGQDLVRGVFALGDQ